VILDLGGRGVRHLPNACKPFINLLRVDARNIIELVRDGLKLPGIGRIFGPLSPCLAVNSSENERWTKIRIPLPPQLSAATALTIDVPLNMARTTVDLPVILLVVPMALSDFGARFEYRRESFRDFFAHYLKQVSWVTWKKSFPRMTLPPRQ
jgi:hypothetical protein